jgi:hypothetical protein
MSSRNNNNNINQSTVNTSSFSFASTYLINAINGVSNIWSYISSPKLPSQQSRKNLNNNNTNENQNQSLKRNNNQVTSTTNSNSNSNSIPPLPKRIKSDASGLTQAVLVSRQYAAARRSNGGSDENETAPYRTDEFNSPISSIPKPKSVVVMNQNPNTYFPPPSPEQQLQLHQDNFVNDQTFHHLLLASSKKQYSLPIITTTPLTTEQRISERDADIQMLRTPPPPPLHTVNDNKSKKTLSTSTTTIPNTVIPLSQKQPIKNTSTNEKPNPIIVHDLITPEITLSKQHKSNTPSSHNNTTNAEQQDLLLSTPTTSLPFSHALDPIRNQVNEYRLKFAKSLNIDPITENEQILIDWIFSPDASPQEIVTRPPLTSLTREKLQCLQDGNWLNDEVINATLTMIQRASNEILIWSTFFYSKLVENDQYTFENVKRWPKKRGVNVSQVRKILFPIHKASHFFLVVLDTQKRVIECLDSLGVSSSDREICLHLAKWYDDETSSISKQQQQHGQNSFDDPNLTIISSSWQFNSNDSIPRQKNLVDCGVFLSAYAACMAFDYPIMFSQENVHVLRQRMVANIVAYG